MVSCTRLGTILGLARNFAHSPGFSCRARSPPVVVSRVVSLPPTISSPRLPTNSCCGWVRITSLCAIIRDAVGSWRFARALLEQLGEILSHAGELGDPLH